MNGNRIRGLGFLRNRVSHIENSKIEMERIFPNDFRLYLLYSFIDAASTNRKAYG